MIRFVNTSTGVEVEYESDFGAQNEWAWSELSDHGEVTVSQVFVFTRADLLNPPKNNKTFDDDYYSFKFGTFEGDYVRIPGRILDIKNDLLISRDIVLKRPIFVAERNISIFGRLSKLLKHSSPIVIGGAKPDAIPKDAFEELLKKFPNTTELNRYASARIHTILSQYLDEMEDARGRYENYLNKKGSFGNIGIIDLEALKKLEIEKYILIRELIKDALATKKNWSEGDWQKLMLSFLLLLFPKYIKVLENVTIHDYYTNPLKKTVRYIDLALVDTNGNLDIIEVKKPFDDKILRKSQYRGNSIPTSELSGGIMQAEKYLFHLSKWGVKGEDSITKQFAAQLPPGMKVRISSPKAIIIVGRDQIGSTGMTHDQLLDFEIIKRKYANMMDIITYDDLLRRLDNTIAALSI